MTIYVWAVTILFGFMSALKVAVLVLSSDIKDKATKAFDALLLLSFTVWGIVLLVTQ